MGSLVTPAFRIAFPNVFVASRNKMSQVDEFSCVALFKKGEDLFQLKKMAQDAAIKKWGDNLPEVMKSPFRNQSERLKYKGYVDGAIFITLKSKQKPQVVNQDVQEILDQSEIYAGCWCKASVNAYAYDTAGNRGVAFGLGNLQKVKDDDPISSRSNAVDDFAPIGGDTQNTAETKTTPEQRQSLF